MPFSWSAFLRGTRKALPIVMGYLPVGFAFGILAAKCGMSVLEATLMGLFVFAGSGQLIAVNMIAGGLSSISIIITTFIINSRHLLMSAALTPFLGKWPRRLQTLFCLQMTDETFALNIGRFAELGVERDEAFGVNAASHLAWIGGGALGAAFGNIIGDIRPYGLDFALIGMFIALLAPHLRIRRHLWAALISGSISVILRLQGVDQWHILIATAASATLCVCLLPGGGAPSRRRAAP